MMLVIQTQDYENYAWREDGSLGVGNEAYWKAKGGSEFKVLSIPQGVDLAEIVEMVRGEIEINNDGFCSHIIGYNVEADDYLSWFEKSQLDYEGVITFKEPTIDYNDLVDICVE